VQPLEDSTTIDSRVIFVSHIASDPNSAGVVATLASAALRVEMRSRVGWALRKDARRPAVPGRACDCTLADPMYGFVFSVASPEFARFIPGMTVGLEGVIY